MVRAVPGLLLVVLATCLVPASAYADPAWTCGAQTGWVSGGGQRADAAKIGGEPCPAVQAAATGATGSAGSLAAGGTVSVDGGTSSQTTDARKPQATVQANSLTIQNGDGKLVVTASGLQSQAAASCDPNRAPAFTSGGTPGSVTVNGRAVNTSNDYSEPGVGVNGAPLFGKITIHFNEVAKTDAGLTRRAIHVVVTDRNGALVFEAAAGEVAVGRDGAVCDPPPVCPVGTQPQDGRCVDVSVTPLPQPPPPAPPAPSTPPGSGLPPTPVGGPAPQPKPRPHAPPTGCRDADAGAGQASARRLTLATLCLLNVQRKAHHLRNLRLSPDLSRAAHRHARDMVQHRYFSHTAPSGEDVVQRILRSGYLQRYGRWEIGENLGWGWGGGATPRSIVAAWMRSAPHRRNVLDKRFNDVGIAVALGSPGGNRSRSITYVIDFGGFQPAR